MLKSHFNSHSLFINRQLQESAILVNTSNCSILLTFIFSENTLSFATFSGPHWLEQSNSATSGKTSCRLPKLGSLTCWSALETLWVWLCGVLFNDALVRGADNLDTNNALHVLCGLPRSDCKEWCWKHWSRFSEFRAQGLFCVYLPVPDRHSCLVFNRILLASFLISPNQSRSCWFAILDHNPFLSSWPTS